MRVLIAPGRYAGALTAVQAASALEAGWRTRASDDAVDAVPVGDGGAGFVDVLHHALGGELAALTVAGPLGDPVPATLLVAGDTAYVEAAQAAGRHLPAGDAGADTGGDAGGVAAVRAASTGVGELLRAAAGTGVRRVVVGVGDCGVLDGGAGLLAALGAEADVALGAGAQGLGALGRVDLEGARAALGAVEVVVAADGTRPLTGLLGVDRSATAAGLDDAVALRIDAALERLAAATDRRASLAPAAGTGSGLGFALSLLGARSEPGFDVVAGATGLAARARAADLVLAGEASFGPTTREGSVPYAVARLAGAALRPCVLVGGEVLVGAREMRALGIEAAYAVVDEVGAERAADDPYAGLLATAARVARTWSR